MEKSISDLFEKINIRGFIDLLLKLLYKSKNRTGHCTFLPHTFYTFSTTFIDFLLVIYNFDYNLFGSLRKVQNMLRMISQIICEHYKERAQENSILPFPFNIMIDPRLVGLHRIVCFLFVCVCQSILRLF
jgi:hypothetical protein